MTFINEIKEKTKTRSLIIVRYQKFSNISYRFYTDDDNERFVWDMSMTRNPHIFISATTQKLFDLYDGKYHTEHERKYVNILRREFNAIQKYLDNMIENSPEYKNKDIPFNASFYLGDTR